MTTDYNVSSKVADRLADKLLKLGREGEAALQKTIVEVTLLTQKAIVEKITHEIDPHSGMHRKHNPQPVVTDLVDTGAYRASWQPSFPGAFEGKVSTNSEYALPLEYGTKDGKRPGFYVARDTAVKMREVFIDKLRQDLKRLLK